MQSSNAHFATAELPPSNACRHGPLSCRLVVAEAVAAAAEAVPAAGVVVVLQHDACRRHGGWE